MSLAENERVRIGDNSRDPLDDEIARWTDHYGTEIDQRAAELSRAQVTNEDEAGRAATLAAIFADLADAAEKKRVEIKKPYLEANKKIDTAFQALTGAATTAKKRIVGMIDAWRNEQRRIAEEARIAAEKEARDKAEAAAKAEAEGRMAEAARLQVQANAASQAAAAPTAPPIVRSAYGQSASDRTVWKFMITDRKKLPKSVSEHPKVNEAIEAVIGALVRSGTRDLPGVKIYPTIETVVRR